MATTRGAPYLFIHSFIMQNHIQTSCSNSPVFIRSSASVQSIYLLYIALSSAPPKHCPPVLSNQYALLSFASYLFTSASPQLILRLFPITFVDQMLLNKATIDPGAHFADWTDWSFSLHTLNRLQVADIPGRNYESNQSQSWTQGQISILASPSIEKLSTINKHTYTYSTTPNQTLL